MELLTKSLPLVEQNIFHGQFGYELSLKFHVGIKMSIGKQNCRFGETRIGFAIFFFFFCEIRTGQFLEDAMYFLESRIFPVGISL